MQVSDSDLTTLVQLASDCKAALTTGILPNGQVNPVVDFAAAACEIVPALIDEVRALRSTAA